MASLITADQLEQFDVGDWILVSYIDTRPKHSKRKEKKFVVDYIYDGGSLRVKTSKNADRSYDVNPALGLRLRSNKTYQLDTTIGSIRDVAPAEKEG